MGFFENVSVNTSPETKGDGLAYLPWAHALALAGRPEHTLVMYGDKPYMEVFGGGVVVVQIGSQLTWLPVLDKQNRPISVGHITSRDISDTYQRCRTKGIATTLGIGMSLYAGFGGDGQKFVAELGLTPDSDLAVAKAITRKKGDTEYLDWASALAAARITDPAFHWSVVMHRSVVDMSTGEVVDVDLPYLKVGNTFMVAVEVSYKGRRHTEWLPIMGVLPVKTRYGVKRLDHQPLVTPNAFDWHRSVKRCLAKAISVASGYGLAVYAGEDLVGEAGDGETNAPVLTDLTEVRRLLQEAGRDEEALCRWLGVARLEDAAPADVTKAESVLRKALGKPATPPPDAGDSADAAEEKEVNRMT